MDIGHVNSMINVGHVGRIVMQRFASIGTLAANMVVAWIVPWSASRIQDGTIR